MTSCFVIDLRQPRDPSLAGLAGITIFEKEKPHCAASLPGGHLWSSIRALVMMLLGRMKYGSPTRVKLNGSPGYHMRAAAPT